jgi:ubiquinone biosynthesis protein
VLVRKSLQDLGMTGLKMGQFLALRSDLLPPEVCRELGKLFEDATPMDFSTVRFVIESDLGEPLENLFSDFQTAPIAAASIAQVHEARSRDGERVAVKVQRPNLERIFNADMRNLRRFAIVIDALGILGELSLVSVADEFAKYTRRELDFLTEGRTADRLRASAVSQEIVPRIFWGLSTRRVLTMEFVGGVSLGKATALLAAGRGQELFRILPDLNLSKATHNLAFAFLHQLFVTGFFQADPHPGNVLLCPGNRVAFLDFGIFGEVSPMQKEVLARYIEEVSMGKLDEAVRYYARVYTPSDRTDLDAFRREAKAVLNGWYESSKAAGSPFRQRMVARFSDEMLGAVRHHHLRISIDTLLFWRAMIVLDATLLQLWDGFDLLSELREFFAQYRPGIIDRALEILVPDRRLGTLVQLLSNSAGRVDEVLSGLVAGRFELGVIVKESPQQRRHENRRLGAIILSLVGISVLALTRISTDATVRKLIWSAALICFTVSLGRLRK